VGRGAAVESFEPTPLAGTQLRVRLAAFLNLLRDNGFLVGLEETADCLRFAGANDLSRQSVLRTGLRSICCRRVGEWGSFD
jgi:uncharacterized protein with von Willebrand factor type A (vWA) domain